MLHSIASAALCSGTATAPIAEIEAELEQVFSGRVPEPVDRSAPRLVETADRWPWSSPPARILLIGSGGSGKSTLARRMGARTGIPVVHLDALYWRPGWVQTPHEEWDRTIAALLARDRWIMDGNYSRTLDQRLAACDAVIFLDLPRLTCLWRIVRRRMRFRRATRPDMGAGCEERLTWQFVRWVWDYPRRTRGKVLAKLDAAAARGARVTILRSAAEVERFAAGPPA